MKGPGPMIGRLVGAALGGAVGKERGDNPVAGALIGAATMMVARRVLPRRIAGLGAAVAAGYIGRKLAKRADRLAEAHGRLAVPATLAEGRDVAPATRRRKPVAASPADNAAEAPVKRPSARRAPRRSAKSASEG